MSEVRLRLVPLEGIDRIPLYVQVLTSGGKPKVGEEVTVLLTASGTLVQEQRMKAQVLATDEHGIAAFAWWPVQFPATSGWLIASIDDQYAELKVHEGEAPQSLAA